MSSVCNVIKLNSRGGTNNKLVQINGESLKYKLETEFCYRVGFKDDSMKECSFIDPSGGPFITIGSVIEGHKVKAIYESGIIEFEL